MPEVRRDASALVTLPIGTTAAGPSAEARLDALGALLRGAAAVSTMAFQAPHVGHCPAHLGEAPPHCWQK